MQISEKLKNKRILVVGAGTTGESVINFLISKKIEFEIYDQNLETVLGFPVVKNVPQGIELALVSPGWRLDHEVIVALKNQGVEIISELDLAWLLKEELNPNQIWLGVTGTNGKTTTVQMLESILNESSFRSIACGNVGLPVIEAVTSSENYEVLAIEVSSFQIAWSNLPKYKAAAILNISDDHIDWHGSFENYADSKIKLLSQSEIAILNLNDPEVILRSRIHNGRKVHFGLDTPQPGEIGIVEELVIDRAFSSDQAQAEVIAELSDIKPTVPHNVSNAMAAAGLALTIGTPYSVIKIGLQKFKLDHHRLELVKSFDGIDWVDDSKATNPHAAKAALNSYLSTIWIAGGLAKGAQMSDLIKRCSDRVKAVILIGKDRELIADEINRQKLDIPIYRVEQQGDAKKLMEDVVSKAKLLANPGDTVLLAPACASMDQFKSYAERGELFAMAVEKLVGK